MPLASRHPEPLPRSFYDRSPELVAQALLGKMLQRRWHGQVLSGRITEVEAYLGLDDPASHAAVGRTARNDVLFGPPGFAYVYFIYGMHFCLNVSCLPDGVAGGVLFRAMLPVGGIDIMRDLRKLPPSAKPKDISVGPGRLCQAMGITRSEINGADMTVSGGPLSIVNDGFVAGPITATPRIGIKKAADRPLRFLLDLASTKKWTREQAALSEAGRH